MEVWVGVISEGFAYGIMALGVWITFRVLDFPDLTVDVSFPLGAAIAVVMTMAGVPFFVTVLFVLAGGALSGAITAAIHHFLKVPGLLASIITLTMFYSIILWVMGRRGNVGYPRSQSDFLSTLEGVFTSVPSVYVELGLFTGVVIVLLVIMNLFLETDLGLLMRTMGNNPQMVTSLGVNAALLKTLGVSLANALVALSGALIGVKERLADITLGQGIIVTGLASVMVGEVLLRSDRTLWKTARVILGSVLFWLFLFLSRLGITALIKPFGGGKMIFIQSSDLKLVHGLTVILILILSRRRADRSLAEGGT
jgi:putative ABC transport system permease protein